MSGVLDRMVQRSRGSLPAIEPLVRAQQTAAAALSIVADENATTVSRGRNAALAGGARALRDESTRLVRDDVRRDAAQDRDATRMDSRRSQALKAAGVNRASGVMEQSRRTVPIRTAGRSWNERRNCGMLRRRATSRTNRQ